MHLETWADIYHPIPFPEFRKLTTQVSDATPYKRLELILANLGRLEGPKVLDLGCNLGFYSFSLARRGAEVTGVELRSDYHGISTAMAREYGVPVRFVNAGLSSELLDSIGRTDCTLCFSMLQWVIAKEGFEQGMALLKRISQLSNILFFDISVNDGKACLTCPPGREISFVHDLLQNNTAYDVIEYIGRVHPYKTDVRHVFVCRRTSAPAP
jgi:SAM-dependent methyltransferase